MERKLENILAIIPITLGTAATAEAGRLVVYAFQSSLETTSHDIRHRDGFHERVVVPTEDGTLFTFTPPYIEISSSPYPFDTPLSIDKRNKESTLPIDLSLVLVGTPNAGGCSLYFDITDANGYEHRNLTIQEIDPNNPNPIYDIRDIIQNNGGILPIDGFQEGVVRMFRVGVYTKLRGDVTEDDQIDFNDLKFITGVNWLKTTHDSNDDYVGNNYDLGDRNHNGWNDFIDLAIIGEDWYTDSNGNPISKVFTPEREGPYLTAFQESAIKRFYGDKAKKVRVARMVVIPNDISQRLNYKGGIIPQLLATKEETETQTPTLRRMLALNNNHNGDLSKYETIDHKLHNNHTRAFLSPTKRKTIS